MNNKANTSHTHSTSDITSGTLSTSRLPTISVSKGGTGRTTLTSGYFLRGNGTGAITMSSVDDVKAELGVISATPPSTTINVGSNVSMANIDWICVHIDPNYQYLMTRYIIGSGIFGQNNIYNGSNAALICMLFGCAIGVWGNEQFGELTVNGVTGFCHIASYDQMNGKFSYFNSDDRRIATNQSGTAQTYWMSTPDRSTTIDDVRIINSNGNFNSRSDPTSARGFRPFVALRL